MKASVVTLQARHIEYQAPFEALQLTVSAVQSIWTQGWTKNPNTVIGRPG